MMPAQAYDTPTKRKILRVVSEENRQYTTGELAEMCHRSESTISRAVSDLGRYPFVAVERVPGSKRRLYGLARGEAYAEPIREFFEQERTRERQGGTVPVHVWNLLEDVTDAMYSKVDGFVELYLFGSYATGQYYAGSDVDLFLLVESSDDAAKGVGRKVVHQLSGDEEIQLLVDEATPPNDGWTSEAIDRTARKHAPVEPGEPLVALHGDSP